MAPPAERSRTVQGKSSRDSKGETVPDHAVRSRARRGIRLQMIVSTMLIVGSLSPDLSRAELMRSWREGAHLSDHTSPLFAISLFVRCPVAASSAARMAG